jgi:hypothetical protein
MNKKETMLKFIKRQEDPNKFPQTIEVLNFKIKDSDDDYGSIGEHFVVECKIRAVSNKSTCLTFDILTGFCLVNVREFRKFEAQERSVIWL